MLVSGFRLLVQGEATVVVFAPESVVQKNAALLKAAVSPDLGLVWSKDGVARLFACKDSGASNLYKAPTSVVLVTADRFATFCSFYVDTYFTFLVDCVQYA